MISPLNQLVSDYLSDITNRQGETVSEIEARSKRIKIAHDAIYKQIVTNFDLVGEEGNGNIDGGSASSIYLITQKIDGGGA